MKAWWKSKTLWFNALCAALVAVEATFGAFQSVLAGNVYATISVVLAVGNAILRIVTTQALK